MTKTDSFFFGYMTSMIVLFLILHFSGQLEKIDSFDKIVLSPSIEQINHYHDECMKDEASNIDKCFDQFDAHMLLYKAATKNNKKQGD